MYGGILDLSLGSVRGRNHRASFGAGRWRVQGLYRYGELPTGVRPGKSDRPVVCSEVVLAWGVKSDAVLRRLATGGEDSVWARRLGPSTAPGPPPAFGILVAGIGIRNFHRLYGRVAIWPTSSGRWVTITVN